MEDLDWMLRCKNKGIRLFYVPDMAVGHQDRETFDALWSHYYEMGKYSVPIRRRNHDSPYHFLFPSGRFSGWLLFLPLTTAMTLFILMRWIKVDLRVLYYLPGLWWANVAYYRGIQHFLDSE
jgi:GT2 family glycosyltransferase